MNKGLIHAAGWAGLAVIGLLALTSLKPGPKPESKPAPVAAVASVSASASSVAVTSSASSQAAAMAEVVASSESATSSASSSSIMVAAEETPARPLNRAGKRCEARLAAVVARRGVRYDFDAYEPTAQGKRALRDIYRVLKRCPADVKLTITGYTDNRGPDAQNRLVSAGRAVAAMNVLTAQGWPDRRVEARGLGSADPVASNATAAGRRQNRRILLTLSPMS